MGGVEALLGIAIGLVATMAGGAIIWLRSSIERQDHLHQLLNQRVGELEVDGLRGTSGLEIRMSKEFGQIRESLAEILSRVKHLEDVPRRDAGDRGHQTGRSGH